MDDIPTIEDVYSEFVPFLKRNEPVIVRIPLEGWELCAESVLCPENEELRRKEVPVDVEGKARTTMTLGEFLDLANKSSASGGVVYCKDWHIDQCAHLKGKYTVPICFRDDWLNWYCQKVEAEDDYSFCYVGTKGSKTGFHHDVCSSYSWSVNLCGVKRWRLWLRESHNVDDPCIDLLQHPGDAIFVPSGCYHEVENLGTMSLGNNGDDDPGHSMVVSVNRNWLNGFSIRQVYRFLEREHKSVQAELIDLYKPPEPATQPTKGVFNTPPPLMSSEEWHRHCDVILLANAAMNWKSFLRLLTARLLFMASALPFMGVELGEIHRMKTAAGTFHEEGRIVELDQQSLEQFELQRRTCVSSSKSGDSGTKSPISVWSHTLSEVAAVLESIRGDVDLLSAFTHIFAPHSRETLVSALGELLSFCRSEGLS